MKRLRGTKNQFNSNPHPYFLLITNIFLLLLFCSYSSSFSSSSSFSHLLLFLLLLLLLLPTPPLPSFPDYTTCSLSRGLLPWIPCRSFRNSNTDSCTL